MTKYNNPFYAYKEALRLIRETKSRQATSLDLNGLGLTTIPFELFQLTELTERKKPDFVKKSGFFAFA